MYVRTDEISQAADGLTYRNAIFLAHLHVHKKVIDRKISVKSTLFFYFSFQLHFFCHRFKTVRLRIEHVQTSTRDIIHKTSSKLVNALGSSN